MLVDDGSRDAAFSKVAPLGRTWDGYDPVTEIGLAKKPWNYRVSACIPHINTIEPLKLVVNLLRLQTEAPYIMVMDTGSPPDIVDQLEDMRADDLEIHFLRGGAYNHSSEPVSAALDLSQSFCRTPYLYQTHSDCFVRRRDFLESLVALTGPNSPVVGYRMSPRDWVNNNTLAEWETMIGHTACMFYMPIIHEIGATWSMQRMHHCFDYEWIIDNGWPDTEVGFNRCLRQAGLKPIFIGYDTNNERYTDINIDHVRNYTGSKLQAPLSPYHKEANIWMAEAMREAIERIKLWSSS